MILLTGKRVCKNFALFFYTILEDLLPAEFFQHFANLICGMFILLQGQISIRDIKKVGLLFVNFFKEMERLYGIEHRNQHSFFDASVSERIRLGLSLGNFHLYTRMVQRELGTYFNGTQSVVEQMAQNFLIHQVVKSDA